MKVLFHHGMTRQQVADLEATLLKMHSDGKGGAVWKLSAWQEGWINLLKRTARS